MEPLPTSQTPSSLELSRIRTGNNITTWSETITKLSFCFSQHCHQTKCALLLFLQVSSIQCPWLPRSMIFRTHLPHAHFLFWQLSEPFVSISATSWSSFASISSLSSSSLSNLSHHKISSFSSNRGDPRSLMHCYFGLLFFVHLKISFHS